MSRRVNCLVGLLILLFAGASALGQVRGFLIESGSNNSGFRIDLLIQTSEFGLLSGFRGGGATMAGEATVAVFPKLAPFEGIIIGTWNADANPTSRTFEFEDGLVAFEVLLTEYRTSLVEPVEVPVKPAGYVNFQIESVYFVVHAAVRVSSKQLGLDATLVLQDRLEAPFHGRIAYAAGDLFLGFTPPPELLFRADPNDLPVGVATLEVRLSLDAGNTNYRGKATPALFGDSDLDGDVDLKDFACSSQCILEPLSLRCRLHDFNEDGAVNLIDYAALQLAFTADAPGP
jgi:hypothetical protein